MASDTAMKAEIERLTGIISQHKAGSTSSSRGSSYPPPPRGHSAGYNRSYINPNYVQETSSTNHTPSWSNTGHPRGREVVIGGVAFKSSKRSLVRKDLAPSTPQPKPSSVRGRSSTRGLRRPYKHQTSYKQHLLQNRKPNRRLAKNFKMSNKQCSRFSATGVCQKGRTCPYRHDPDKIAICWPFLQATCPNTVETCSLSHDPIPERTPLCVHFANNGRCKNGESCLFPHVRVGPREGVCRDFAVLGYCSKGLDCEHQHVRECPDFAEKGVCTTPKCKLPHVIRANRRVTQGKAKAPSGKTSSVETPITHKDVPVDVIRNASIGDEYISLTFHESDSGAEDGGEEEGSEEDGDMSDEDGASREDPDLNMEQ